MIAVADYGIGNLGSVTKAFRRAGAEVRLTGDPEALRRADALVLPGDGAFGATMAEVERRGLVPVLREAVEREKPLLGICVGMQLLFEESEEHGRHAGLALLPGRVRRLEGALPVPHMGWNSLRLRRPHPVLEGVPDGSHVYFVHSYCCDAPEDAVIATTEYGGEVAAVVGKGSILGMQFHPEKSQDVGLRLVSAFVRLVEAARRARLQGVDRGAGAALRARAMAGNTEDA
jgi:glutamine amidotransferase